MENQIIYIEVKYNKCQIHLDDKGTAVYHMIEGKGFLVKEWYDKRPDLAFKYIIKMFML